MATIGVIADTHVPQRLRRLPDGIPAAFRGVDLILHAGDLNSVRVMAELEEIAPVQAVVGNADLFRSGLPLTRVLEIEGRRIGLTHGHGGWARYLVGKGRDLLGENGDQDQEDQDRVWSYPSRLSFGPIGCIDVQPWPNRAALLQHLRPASGPIACLGRSDRNRDHPAVMLNLNQVWQWT